ncbi:MAG: DUF4846 domain-containing protein [Bacteroidia bacterium]
MRNVFYGFLIVFFVFQINAQTSAWIKKEGTDILTRIRIPENTIRVEADSNSFGHFLRHLNLKADGTSVKLYNGNLKYDQEVHVAIFDVTVGKKDLQQCADATMRLRAEYLFKQKRYDDIHFNFTNGFNAEYAKWRKGFRISVKGNKVTWVKTAGTSDARKDFEKYLEMVFSYAGTLSLSRELKKKELKELQIGDLFIQGGSPGHAVIVVDVVKDKKTGKKLFMLAQSYMPAQDIHILKNPSSNSNSPWYSLKEGDELITPEWEFSPNSLFSFD